MEKTIKEIFKDYNSNSFSLNASKIKNMNLFKKTNKLNHSSCFCQRGIEC